jgi:hypothetical protein
MISVYVLAYNEELILPFFIKHYRSRFPECKITIYDNYSSDSTTQIAQQHNCEIIKFNSDNQINEHIYLSIKNNCWKQSSTDWNIVCDVDEFLDINIEDIKLEEYHQHNMIKATAYDMININSNSLDIDSICYGIRNAQQDKCFLFNKKYIQEINYDAGCHKCKPISKDIVRLNTKSYLLYHMKYIDENILIKKYQENKIRLSDINKKKNWGYQYNQTPDEIKNLFKEYRLKAKKIR